MKITNITHSAFAVLLLTSSMAGAETTYPASDFQPKVVYQDPDYQHAGTSSASSAQAPSAKVVDSQYPASDFQPKVLYNDPSYQHAQPAANSATSMQKGVAAPAADSTPEAKKEESSSSYLLGLFVLAAVGFVLFRKKSSEGTKEASNTESYRSAAAGGMTGVAKYISRKAGTGVSRYLEQQVKSTTSAAAATGVAKYLSKQTDSVKQSDSEAATGVEKYLRNRG